MNAIRTLPARIARQLRITSSEPMYRCGARTRSEFGTIMYRCLEPVDELGQHCSRHSGCLACERHLFPGHRHITRLGLPQE